MKWTALHHENQDDGGRQKEGPEALTHSIYQQREEDDGHACAYQEAGSAAETVREHARNGKEMISITVA